MIFTSLSDNRYGQGGTFGTSNVSGTGPAPGDWAGFYVEGGAFLSMESVLVAYGGGLSRVEGTFAGFSTIELRGAEARIAGSVFESNASGLGGQGSLTRSGRGRNAASVIYVVGTQPIVIDNFFLSNQGPPINIDVNSLTTDLISDFGRSIGNAEAFVATRLVNDGGNQGPLVRNNLLEENLTNGMEIRGGPISVDTVWDDTDIAHVLFDEVIADNNLSIRLESSPTESLVVKLQDFGGFTTVGTPDGTIERVGGSLQIVGQPGHPVELTSYEDDAVGAGNDGRGIPQVDTNGGGRPERTDDSFDIIVNYGPTMVAKPQAVKAVETAVQLWEQLIEDPITITFDFELEPLPPGVIGGAQPEYTSLDFDTVRQAMIDDGRGDEVSLLQQLPTFDALNVLLPNDRLNPYSVVNTMELTVPNAKALGFAATGPPSDFDPAATRDGNLRFSSDFYFDYDSSDGIHPDAVDFFYVVLHEIGHALGFVSKVDDVGAGLRQVDMNPLDLFRLEPGEGAKDFAVAQRVLDPGIVTHVFYDGGVFDPSGIPVPGLTLGDIPLSTVNDGNQASHWKDDALIAGVHIGLMDPTAPAVPVYAITGADRSAFDLMGWDIVGGGIPRDWLGILFEPFTNDRNVELVTELEATDLTDEGANSNSNSEPDFAEFLGILATDEKSSDEIRRLGFQIQGYLNQPSDEDVYSFRGKPGTEVWLDIDATTSWLDTVVELVNINGDVLARSDNSDSLAESFDDAVSVFLLDKSPYLDAESQLEPGNPHDAGMRLFLPGQLSDDDGTYHVRVSSKDGLTAGAYQLQIRLQETDEVPGTTVRLSNISYANSGIRARGVPGNSPIIGESIEDGSLNDAWCTFDLVGQCVIFPTPGTDFVAPQQLGELTGTDRSVISVAGALDPGDPVDWYQFSLGSLQSLIINVDYAGEEFLAGEGFPAHPDIAISLYDAVSGRLVYYSSVSLDIDDFGESTEDLSRGSFEFTDPLIGPIPAGDYLMAVHPEGEPPEFGQFSEYLPEDPNVRVLPNPQIERIQDNDLNFAPVPFHLGDITLFATSAYGAVEAGETRRGQLFTVDPFTGRMETRVGSFGPEIGDVAMRADGRLFSLSRGVSDPDGPTDANSGNFLEISPAGFADPVISLLINDGDGELIDDGILTFEDDPNFMPPDPLPDPPPTAPIIPSNGGAGVGIQFNALTYGFDENGFPVLFAVGSRGEPTGVDPPIGPEFTQNLLYVIDGGEAAFDGNGTDGGTALPPDRRASDIADMEMTAYTDVIERGHVGITPAQGMEGTVTGIAIVGSTMYGVSDKGELLRINSYQSDAASATLITTILNDDGDAIRFSSLSVGPSSVERNAYRNLLFAMDSGGRLYAFTTTGELQPIFVDGATSVATGVGGSNGIAFGTRTINPWTGGTSLNFGTDPTLAPVDAGQPNPGTLDVPGGVYGSIVSDPFSLAGYSEGDNPYLYFNYNLQTQNDRNSIATPQDIVDAALDVDLEIETTASLNVEAPYDPNNPNPADIDRDTLRLYIADGQGGWELLASSVAGEMFNNEPVIELFDNSWYDEVDATLDTEGNLIDPLSGIRDDGDPVPRGVIERQARIPLLAYAGLENLQLRFEFSTAGTMNLGDMRTVGSELRVIAGNDIPDGSDDPDGSAFEIDDQIFEFERGVTISTITAAGISDTDTVEITDSGGQTILFEFDLEGTLAQPNSIAVPITPTDTPEAIATALGDAIASQNIAVFQNGNELNLPNVVDVVAVPNFTVVGAFGISDPTHHEVLINAGMSSDDVTDVIVQALADVFAGGNTQVIKNYASTISIIGHRITDSGPLGMADRSQRLGEEPGVFFDPSRGQYNTTIYATYGEDADAFEAIDVVGTSVSGITIGFASNGEAVADGEVDPPGFDLNGDGLVERFTLEPPMTLPGTYQVEIRVSDLIIPLDPPLDPRDRISSSVSLFAQPGYLIADGSTFAISDGIQVITFEFDDVASNSGLVNAANIALPFDPSDSAFTVAQTIRDAVNAQNFDVEAISPDGSSRGLPTSERIDLIGIAVLSEGETDSGIAMDFEEFELFGSQNLHRAQGQLIIQGNRIAFSGEYGIIYEDAYRDLPTYNFFARQADGQFTTGDYIPHAAPVRNLVQTNDENLTTGITIVNNVVADNGRGGIHVSGDPNGIILIAPTLGPVNSMGCEAWDEDTFAISDIPDSQVDETNTVFFEFDFNNDGLVNVNTIPVVLPIPTPSQNPPPCSPNGTYRSTVADAIETAIRSSNLDVQTYRGKGDEIFLEGATALFGVRNVAGNLPFWSWPDYIAEAQIGEVPFARILNNTIVGHGGELFDDAALEDVGILIDENANPTILNNVLANLTTGIQIDGDIRRPAGSPAYSSQSTIVGSSIYFGNVRNVFNIDIGDFGIELNDNEPLFVDIENGNYYPAAFSRLIDSSVDSLEDRPVFVGVKDPLGINLSPIIAPTLDVTGQLRVDDPDVEPPDGIGRNVFKDRGAVERADFNGPTAEIIVPQDNDVGGNDTDPRATYVQSFDTLSQFRIKLDDRLEFATSIQGTGADPATVTSKRVVLTSNGRVLNQGVDYRFSYNSTNRVIQLTSLSGVWPSNRTYVVTLNAGLDENGLDPDGDRGISDLATNLLQANQGNGETRFTIVLGGTIDYGDAGPGYPTLEADDGARHEISRDLLLGSLVDAEPDGQPAAEMNLDRSDDGIVFHTPLTVGTEASLTVLANVGITTAFVDGWIDFNRDGDWDDPGEQILTSVAVTPADLNCVNNLPCQVDVAFSVPEVGNGAVLGFTGSRFRISSSGLLSPTGAAADGEVEDFLVEIVDTGFDYGDAPISFPTTAKHRLSTDVFRLGPRIDAEGKNLASMQARGDGSDDDGVHFAGPLVLGQDASVEIMLPEDTVIPAGGAKIDAWIDFNRDGLWTPAEKVLNAVTVSAGLNMMSIPVPLTAVAGDTFARFRLSSAGGLEPGAEAADGEVEDYLIEIAEPSLDFGDAPDGAAPETGYPTLLANDGARHIILAGFFLGATIDFEGDGQPNETATGDGADEDGIAFPAEILTGMDATLTVTASDAGLVDAWIDFNADGDWDDAGEQILVSASVDAGANMVDVPIAATVHFGLTYARFRFSSVGGLTPSGPAPDGEVEDYQITIAAGSWHNAAWPTDVNGVNGTTPLDALIIIAELTDRMVSDPVTGELQLPVAPPPFYDVDNNGIVSPLDALMVISELPTLPPQAPLATRQEAAAPVAPLAATFLRTNAPADRSKMESEQPRAQVVLDQVAVEPDPTSRHQLHDVALRSVKRFKSSSDGVAASLSGNQPESEEETLDNVFSVWK